MSKSLTILRITLVLAIAFAIALLISFNTDRDFSLGLDLAGGARITYMADVSQVPKEEITGRMSALRDVIERRVNGLGVSEASVYVESTSLLIGLPREYRLIVELPGVTDLEEAIKEIGETPVLEFALYNRETEQFEFISLNGGHIDGAEFTFLHGPGGALTSEPAVNLHFNSEGSKIFSDLTRENVGETLGIFLDGQVISSPVIVTAILGGTTQISGSFTIESAKELADNLNFGALPLNIELSGTNTIDPTLGKGTIDKSALTGIIALIIITSLFVIIYRLVGVFAIVALISYVVFMLAIFKSIPIVLTAAGLAGFIMSLGFAIDANVLIFERMREELAEGKNFQDAVENGFNRAWISIRDANISSLIIAALLFWFGTSVVKGFALVFIMGVLVSILTAFIVSRYLLRALAIFIKKSNFFIIPK